MVAIIADYGVASKWLLLFQIIVVWKNDCNYFRLWYLIKMWPIISDYSSLAKRLLLLQIKIVFHLGNLQNEFHNAVQLWLD